MGTKHKNTTTQRLGIGKQANNKKMHERLKYRLAFCLVCSNSCFVSSFMTYFITKLPKTQKPLLIFFKIKQTKRI